MRIEDLNWMDVENYLKNDNRLMLVMGACEQHGYLSMLTDVKIPLAIADAASERTGVPVAPELNYGVSPYFIDFPGTISLRLQTFLHMIEDIVRCVYHQGFHRLLVLNGHGGNTPAQTLLYELANDLPDLSIEWYAWWMTPNVLAVAEKFDLIPYHAAWSEAFPFVRVAPLPDGFKEPVELGRITDAKTARQLYGDGVFGGQYKAQPEVMEQIFNAAVEDVVPLLERLQNTS